MGLRRYFQKRSFKHTPEPQGSKKQSASPRLAFVVQEHHASSLHYDFRLELDGVLKSWAIPKGPSLDPHEHHLAVETEDHPYDYRKFEGVIPEGNYGAGNVIIWDEGWYEPRTEDSIDQQKTLRAEYKKGHLTFILHGHKLKGEFALIQMHGQPAKNWLLVKKTDEFASNNDITKQDQSVKSRQRVDDLGAKNKLPDLSKYPRKSKLWQVTPMFCTLVDEPFDRQDWLFEMKWDGYRAIGTKHQGEIELYSRNHNDFIDKYPPVVEALRNLKHDVILDGEVVVVDSKGQAHFEWLQNWRHDTQGNLLYYLFDILWCDGRDVRSMPLSERKRLLQTILPANDDVLRYSDDLPTQGLKLFKEVQKHGMEGIVAKQADSPYREGVRGPTWLKIKTHLRQEVVIGGYTEPRGGRQYLGALIVGVYKDGELHYVGHSGGGIADEQRKTLRDKLAKLERRSSPFVTEPKPNAPVHWVRPEIVCEMSFSEWTSEGSMRQPQFKGLRSDKPAKDIHRESAVPQTKATKSATQQTSDTKLELTHLDKVFFPKTGYTKGDLIKYYQAVADYILPYLKDRPCSLLRMPNGITGEGFFQKNHEHLPTWVPSTNIFSESNNKDLHWVTGGNLDSLLYMVQLGCVEINPWNSRVGHLDNPDWIVIDLDPEGVTFEQVISVAQTVKAISDDWKIPSYPKTSGKTGIHIYIPLHARYSYDQAKNFAHLFAIEVNKRQPKITSVLRMPAKRPHKIYVDFLQNRQGQTLAAPYSVRPTPTATVSTPLHWDEVKKGLKPEDFNIKNTPNRLKHTGDLWKPVVGTGIDLAAVLKRLPKPSEEPK